MQNIDSSTEEGFNKVRERLIEIIKGVKYEDDPHLLLSYGNHDGVTCEGVTCSLFEGSIVDNLQKKAGVLTEAQRAFDMSDFPENLSNEERGRELVIEKEAVFTNMELFVIKDAIGNFTSKNNTLTLEKMIAIIKKAQPGVLRELYVTLDVIKSIGANDEIVKMMEKKLEESITRLATAAFKKRAVMNMLLASLSTKIALYENALIQ